MAKIDTTKIEGYDTMTPEQKLAALEAFEYEDYAAEAEKYKNQASKANSEAADWKRKHNALLSDDEKRKQENAEELENLRSQVAAMQQEKTIAGHKAHFLALGYAESLAEETAVALANGEVEKVFANQKKFLEAHDKSVEADLLKNTPRPKAGSVSDSGASDYNKKAEAAKSEGNYSEAAYFMRLAHEIETNR